MQHIFCRERRCESPGRERDARPARRDAGRRWVGHKAGLVTIAHQPAPLGAELGEHDAVAAAAVLDGDRRGAGKRHLRTLAAVLVVHGTSLIRLGPLPHQCESPVGSLVGGPGARVSRNDASAWSLVKGSPTERPAMKTTIVLVHGAFAESASWDGVIDALLEADLPVIAAANPLRGLAADAKSVSDLVRSIDGPVLLVGHSYGCAVITNVDADAGDIVGLVYTCGFAPEAGESAFTLAGKFPGSTLGEALEPVARADGTTDLRIIEGPLPPAVLRRRAGRHGRADGRDAAAGHAGGAGRALGRAPALEGTAVVVRDRRGGPQHPRRHAALHGRARRRPARGRGPRRLARHLGLAAAPDRGRDPRGRVGRAWGSDGDGDPHRERAGRARARLAGVRRGHGEAPVPVRAHAGRGESRARRRPVRLHREAARRGALDHRAGRRRRRAGADRAAPWSPPESCP